MAVKPASETIHTTSSFPQVFNWAGSKRLVAKHLLALALPHFRCYYEPFLGSGAIFLALASQGLIKEAILSDINPHLIGTFKALQTEVDEVLRTIRLHSLLDSEVHFSGVSRRLNQDSYDRQDSPERAADFIYALSQSFHSSWYETTDGNIRLNRRTDPKPFRPKISSLSAAAGLLKYARVHQMDFRQALDKAVAGDLVVLDPPYLEENNERDPRGYTACRFSKSDIRDLETLIISKVEFGVHILFCWGSKLSTEAFSKGDWVQLGRDYVWTSFPLTSNQ